MTDYIADDFSAIAAGLRKLEEERKPVPEPDAPRKAKYSKPWVCQTCSAYKADAQVTTELTKPRCLVCGEIVILR